MEEFKPINKLPVYKKFLEIIVQRQLVDYLENNELFQECQSGFRCKHYYLDVTRVNRPTMGNN